MPSSQPFIDYYAVLQVHPDCDLKIIESAYRHFAKIYHPDHELTADADRFATLSDAYNALKFAEKRANYDELYRAHQAGQTPDTETVMAVGTALSDAALQQNILFYLYRIKRERFRSNGAGPFVLQQHFGCSDDNFDFHVWYLKAKGFVETTEHGTLAITVQGVDHVISLHQNRPSEKFLTDQSESPGAGTGAGTGAGGHGPENASGAGPSAAA